MSNVSFIIYLVKFYIYIIALLNIIHAQIALPSFHGAHKPHTSVSSSGTQTFTYTGSQQTFTVPSGVSTITIEAWGSRGGNVTSYKAVEGGKGAYAKGDLNVNQGDILYVYVGGRGEDRLGNHVYGSCTLVNGGFNGGGSTKTRGNGTPGGGASDIRVGGNAFSNRIIVASGGGGSAWNYAAGGAGGALTGVNGTKSNGSGTGGGGGTQSAGGAVGLANEGCGFKSAGSLGTGGNASGHSAGGGAGGGGYYGGGGGGYNDGGGGGSSYIGGVSNAQSIAGNSTMPNPDGGTMTGRDDNGLVVISW